MKLSQVRSHRRHSDPEHSDPDQPSSVVGDGTFSLRRTPQGPPEVSNRFNYRRLKDATSPTPMVLP